MQTPPLVIELKQVPATKRVSLKNEKGFLKEVGSTKNASEKNETIIPFESGRWNEPKNSSGFLTLELELEFGLGLGSIVLAFRLRRSFSKTDSIARRLALFFFYLSTKSGGVFIILITWIPEENKISIARVIDKNSTLTAANNDVGMCIMYNMYLRNVSLFVCPSPPTLVHGIG